MALLTSAPISNLAIELLARQLTLVATVSKVPSAEYANSGGSVTVAVPVPRAAREQLDRSDPIVYESTDEVPVSVPVAHYYDSTLLSDEEATLDLRNFGRQIVRPQTEAVARAAEDQLADVMNGLDPHDEIEWAADPDPAADRATVLQIRELLTTNDCPAGDRWVACSPDTTTRLLSVPGFTEADKRGASTALEAAEVGQVFGLRFVESAAIDPGNAVGYHRSGFVFGSARPADPRGGVDSTTVTDGGVSLRVIRSYDPGHLSEAVVTSVFAGAAVVPEDEEGDVIKRAIRVTVAGS